jgi:hypothetical protein
MSTAFSVANLSDATRCTWFDVIVPFQEGRDLPAFCRTAVRGWPAVKEEALGIQGWRFAVRGGLEGVSMVRDAVVRSNDPAPAFAPSEWVDDRWDLLTVTVVVVVNGVENRIVCNRFQVSESAASRRYTLWGRCPTLDVLCADGYLIERAGDDVVELKIALRNSHPERSTMGVLIQDAWIETGELLILDDRNAFGFGTAELAKPEVPAWGPFKSRIVQHPTWLGAWCEMHVRGAFLCLPNDVPFGMLLLGNAQTKARVANAAARIGGPVIACPAGWDDALETAGFLGTHYVPRPVPNDYAQLLKWAGKVVDWFNRPGADYQDQRPLGQLKGAGSTGDQEDFGAGKKIVGATLGNPVGIYLMRGALSEMCRPIHHYEADGSLVKVDKHPDLVFWSQGVHYSTTVSPDRLGKPVPEPANETGGFGGKDNQHDSDNNLHAVIACTGDEVLLNVVRAEIEKHRGRSSTFVDVSRGQGRPFHSMADEYLLTADERIFDCLMHHVENSYHASAAKGWLDDKTRTVRAVSWSMDDRLLKIWDPVQEKFVNAPCWSVWGEGLNWIGLRAAARAAKKRAALALKPWDARADLALRLCYEVGATVMRHGFFVNEFGAWDTAAVVLWQQGENQGKGVPEYLYRSAGAVGVNTGPGIYEWSIPCIYGMVELLEQDLQTMQPGDVHPNLGGYTKEDCMDLARRGRAIMESDRLDTITTWQQREWRAVSREGAGADVKWASMGKVSEIQGLAPSLLGTAPSSIRELLPQSGADPVLLPSPVLPAAVV